MATKSRRTDPPLSKMLIEEGYKFDFFQAVRLLEQQYPERQSVGIDSNPLNEIVRFRSQASLTFPPNSIHEITEMEDGPLQMTIAFMGLTGPSGVLPRHYTELLIERIREKDFVLKDFLDLFNHRLVSLFYRAWEKYRPNITSNRGQEKYARDLLSLIGLGTPGLPGRLKIEDRTLLFYTGLIAQHPCSVNILESLLQDFFQVPMKIDQFIGQWFKLDESNRSYLHIKGMNNELGISTVAGENVWDQQTKFRIRIGPIGYDKFFKFLPINDAFDSLNELVRFLVGQELDFDVQLILIADEVPSCRLGDTNKKSPRLGWSTWLKIRDFTRDSEDVVIGVN